MISDEKMASLIRHWDTLTPAQRAKTQETAADMRLAAILGEPFACPSLEIWRLSSSEISKEMADMSDALCTDRDGAFAPIEVEVLKALQTPAVLAWEHTYQHLERALQDGFIKNNHVAVRMLENALVTAMDSADNPGEISLYEWAERDAISKRAAAHASAKNSAPRAWVLIEWAKRVDRGQSKAAFGRQYALLVKSKFKLNVGPETISRDWLPKNSK